MLMKAPASAARAAISGPVSPGAGAGKSSGRLIALMCQASPIRVSGAFSSAAISVVKPSERSARVSVIGKP